LNETLLWILYCVSGVLAFAVVYKGRLPVGLGVLAAVLATGAGWALLYQLTDVEKRPAWVQLDLSLNLTFGLIFGVFAVALAKWLLKRRETSE